MTDATRVALYANSGTTLFHYSVDLGAATLVRRGSITLPLGVQYAAPHPRKSFLYVACSNGSPGVLGDRHCVAALRIDPANGQLLLHGDAVALRARPIHITVDGTGAHAFIAYNDPSGLTVHRIEADGALSAAIEQEAALDVGVFAHQARVTPSNGAVILVTRGNDAAAGRPEDPGALKVFDYRGDQLRNAASIAPGGGFGFGPRHLDFHPGKPWVYVSIERQNEIHVYRMRGDALEPEPAFVATTLSEPGKQQPEQRAGAIHVHPSGRFVYLANRASASVEFGGRKVFAGGENNIAVYAIDAATGAPQLVQHIDTHGFVPRTFAIDPGGRLLIVANAETLAARNGASVETIPANVALFRIGEDGKLTYVAKREIDSGGGAIFWMGLVTLASGRK
jgi:6-phosphogluconolactonase (cycloisomerase 2 family)